MNKINGIKSQAQGELDLGRRRGVRQQTSTSSPRQARGLSLSKAVESSSFRVEVGSRI
jgi:hypothetical protein